MEKIGLLAVVGIFFGLVASAQGADKLSEVFLRDVIQENLSDIQMGQLAQEIGQSEGVKSFGAIVMVDCWIWNEQAQKIATQLGIPIPTEPNIGQKLKYERISKLSGKMLDIAFVTEMIATHQALISRFQNQAKKTDDPIAVFAHETLPVLEEDLNEAKKLRPRL